jgi:Fe2+ transport system protein FeoA
MWSPSSGPILSGAFPLTLADPSHRLQCVAVLGGHGLRRHLAAMGLVPGVAVAVLNSTGPGGPVVIRIRDTRLALGRGMAQKVMVRRVTG